MGSIMGIVGNLIQSEPKDLASPLQRAELAIDPVCGMNVDTAKGLKTEYGGKSYYFCSPHCQAIFEREAEEYATAEQCTRSIRIKDRVNSAFRYGFADMVKEIGPEILLGLALAALVVTVTPVGKFVGTYFSGGLGYLFSLVLGLLMYVCSTASPPLVKTFLSQGMNIGAGLVLLLVGPITSWGTILVLKKEFGGKIRVKSFNELTQLRVVESYKILPNEPIIF